MSHYFKLPVLSVFAVSVKMVLYYYRTAKRNAEIIRIEHKIKVSTFSNDPKVAKFGDGVYFTKELPDNDEDDNAVFISVDIPEGDYRMVSYSSKGKEGFRFIQEVDLNEFPGWKVEEKKDSKDQHLDNLLLELEERVKADPNPDQMSIHSLVNSLTSEELKVYF